MSRRVIVAGNWKMNQDLMGAFRLASEVITDSSVLEGNISVVLAPPYLYLHAINGMRKDCPQCKIAAQNCHYADSGAYTGEISPKMLKDLGVDCVILGHSERRKYFGETHELLAKKVDAVLSHDMEVIFCCGEPLEVREAATHEQHVKEQLEQGLFHLSANQFKKVVVAYEPVWAIGTGKTASPEQAQSMHKFIRTLIEEKYSAEIAQECTILYGGSCKPSNAKELFSQPDVDGGLVGGAALKKEDFMNIVRAGLSTQ
ncbi:MAG: triose-phosphate isomerase [Aureispira sp.]|nr:triose-phosphate isomerase [Aureispira sp.]